MIDLTIRTEQRRENIRAAKEKGAVLPNLAQLRTPDLIPQALRSEPMFRAGWYSREDGSFAALPRFAEIPPEISGVPCRILALKGDPAAGAAFGCRLKKIVTGEGDWNCDAEPEQDFMAALWHYNITGWALCDLFESRKRAGDRLFGVCIGSAQSGLSAAGDLIKARYPRAKLAVGTDGIPQNCNIRGLDLLCRGTDPIGCCAAVARYFELDGQDVLLTVLPGEISAPPVYSVKELSYPTKKELHTFQKRPDTLWQEAVWTACYDRVIELDRLINVFNDGAEE